MFKMFAIRQKSSNHVLKWAVILLSLAMAVWNFYNLKFYSLFETEYVYLWEDTSFAKKTCVFVHCKEFDFKSSALQCCCRLYQYKGRSIPEVGDHIISYHIISSQIVLKIPRHSYIANLIFTHQRKLTTFAVFEIGETEIESNIWNGRKCGISFR